MKEFFLEVLGKTLNMPVDKVAALVFKTADDGTATDEIAETAQQAVTQALAAHISSVKGSGGGGKADFDKGHAAGMKDALSKLEGVIKTEFGLESAEKGLALVKDAAAKAAKANLADDAVKLHPLYIAKEREAQTVAENLKAEHAKQVESIRGEYSKKERFTTAQEKILQIFEQLKPVLPANPVAAATMRREFAAKFSEYDFDIQSDGSIIVTKDGKRVENNLGHARTLDDLVKAEAEIRFDFQVQDAKGASGNDNAGGKPAGSAASPQNFKDLADFTEKYNAEPDPAKRAELGVAWEAMEAAGTV